MQLFVKTEIKAIVAEGAFGKNCNLVSFNMYNDIIEKKKWKYRAIFGDIVTSDESHYSVLIKFKNRESSGCDVLFQNELNFYEKIIPFLLECRGPLVNDVNALSLPRFFYGRNNGGELAEKDLIVFENVNTLGYRFTEEQMFMDNDHLIIALQAIAKFHGLSYIAKHKNASRLLNMVADIQDLQFDGNGYWMAQNDRLKRIGKRGVDRLLERDGERYRDHEQLRRLNKLFDDATNTLRRAMGAHEPLSVLCHGEYCHGNVMFQYDDSGRPFDALIMDFFESRYGSPALDLSLFLYTTTTQQVRETHWNDLLDAYWAALTAAVPPGVRFPNRAELDAEMAASAIVGFLGASFILPYKLRDNSDQLLDSVATSDDPVDYFLVLGGDACTDCLADLVQHMVDLAYTQPCNALG
ncbi:uncharacterized protein LOC132945860 [Metopolophium dirhodum]|uniref:uncharacterized protein LOC132945860 n=1 Tax=Metopolophium dirhodum TaxID=44670 RepID=UPI00298FDF3E|nr:uncharacterized protein LOC132945860 [Metopolophium dirhodum]